MADYKNLSLTDVKTAYRKLKTLIYYDTYDLFMKAQIADFETETSISYNTKNTIVVKNGNVESKLINLHKALTTWDDNKKKDYWENIFNTKPIGYRVLPKSIKPGYHPKKHHLIKNLFTNVREISDKEKYEIDKLIFYIDAPIEVHIVSVLWIIKLGYILESDLDSRCYGNRLVLENRKANSFEKRTTDDQSLFKPYYNQYQKWRDEGISVARNYLERKQDVLFINVDIKDYYYSVRLNLNKLNKRLQNLIKSDWENLIEVFNKVHIEYSNLLKNVGYPDESIKNISKEEIILPIGLPSSYILANWYLQDFDKRVNQGVRPLYYSRYVDDIFIVIAHSNLNIEKKSDLNIPDTELSESINNSLTDTEYYIIKILKPVIDIREYPDYFSLDSSQDRPNWIFKLVDYDHLYIQPSKTLVYYFNHEFSLALLDKFKSELEKKSSEFRFLPDEELEKDGFDDEAYELVYDDSEYKIKTLKDYKENRFGIASYLSKKIFYSLRNGKKNTQSDAKKILNFFRGTTNLENFRQWERLITYFIVNDNKEEFIKLSIRTFEQIFSLPLTKKLGKFQINYVKVANDLLEYYSNAMEIALALNPDFSRQVQYKIVKIFNRFYQEFLFSNDRPLKIFQNLIKFRLSNMIRHNYVCVPLLNYTNISTSSSLIEPNLSEIPEISRIKYNENLINYSPRKVRYCEVAWMECIQRITNKKTPSNKGLQNQILDDILFADSGNKKNYLETAFERYLEINYWYKLGDRKFANELRKEIFDYGETLSLTESTNGILDSHLIAHEISVSQKDKIKNLKVGLANMKVDEKNYLISMLGKPNLKNRYAQFAKVLNDAEEENCELVVLPELSLPHGLVKTILDHSWSTKRAIISGIEHWNHNNVVYNFILTVLPCKIRGINDAVPVLRLKNHYAPLEELWINEYRMMVPKPTPFRYHLFRWRGLYFSVYYCFELADILHRAIFKSKVDFLIASEWNPDINLYSNIIETTTRDLHCYFIQVNTSQYGDSRVTRPTKTELKDSLRIKGGKNTALLVDELEIEKLRVFQYKGFGLQKDDKGFKPTPASYDHEDARKRQENKSFKKNKN